MALPSARVSLDPYSRKPTAVGMIRIGVLTPHTAIGPEEEFPAMAPGRVTTEVVRVSNSPEDDAPTSPVGLRALTAAPVLDDAAKAFAPGSVQGVGYASTTSAYAIGFDAEAAMVSRLSARLGVPVVGTCKSAVDALRLFGVERLALIGAPWFAAELNELGGAYFRSQGFDVVSSASAELSQPPDRIEPADVCAWTSRHVRDEADGIFIGGNGFRAAAAIEPLEAAIGRPVLTSNQVLLWGVLTHTGEAREITGYGRLFAHTL